MADNSASASFQCASYLLTRTWINSVGTNFTEMCNSPIEDVKGSFSKFKICKPLMACSACQEAGLAAQDSMGYYTFNFA